MKALLALLICSPRSRSTRRRRFRSTERHGTACAIPLRIVPIYVDRECHPVRRVQIEMEVYVKGELKRTITTGGLSSGSGSDGGQPAPASLKLPSISARRMAARSTV